MYCHMVEQCTQCGDCGCDGFKFKRTFTFSGHFAADPIFI